MSQTDAAAAEKPASTELVDKEDQNTAVAVADDFFDGAGEGLDDFSQGDFLVPYVRIIQALSKELQKGHQKYIAGAQNGMIVNSATKKLYDGEKGIYVVPIHYSRRYQSWKPNNGGPADDHGSDSTLYDSLTPNDQGKRIDGNGNEWTSSGQYFVLIVDVETGDHELAVLSFSGSQAKKSRQWNSQIAARREKRPDGKSVQPAMWFYTYHVITTPESNEKGQWYGFSISEGPKVMDVPNGKEIFQFAKETRRQVEGGALKAAAEEPEPVDDDEGTEQAF